MRNWLIGMLSLVGLLVVLGFYGDPKWYLLAAIEMPGALILTAAMTVMMISLFNDQLKKLA